MNGYMHMLRDHSNPKGICGINTLASYPIKTGENPPLPPPSPPPGPTRCDIFTHCAAGETCCCAKRVVGICFSWRCCELDSAVCCKDQRHCCPRDYPICDTERTLCLQVCIKYESFFIKRKNSRMLKTKSLSLRVKSLHHISNHLGLFLAQSILYKLCYLPLVMLFAFDIIEFLRNYFCIQL